MDEPNEQSPRRCVPVRQPGRYFFLLLGSFLAIVILPVVVFGVAANRWFADALVAESREYSERLLGYLRREIDSDLLSVETELLDIDLSGAFRALSGASDPDDPATIYQARLLQVQLAQIVARNEILHSTILYFPALNRVLTEETTSLLQSYQNRDLVESVVDGSFGEGLAIIVEPGTPGEERHVYVVTRQRPYGTLSPRVRILANLDLEHVRQRLEQFHAIPETTLSVVSEGVGTIVSTSPDVETAPAPAEDVTFAMPSTLRAWTYRTTLPASYFQTRTRPARYLIAQLATILIVGGVVASYALSRQLYSPIQRVLREIGREVEREQRDRRSEFALIDEAVHRILESNRYLSRLLEVHEQSIRNSVFRRLLDGTYIPPDVLDTSLSFIGFPREWRMVATAIIELETEPSSGPADEEGFFRRLAIAEVAERIAGQMGYTVFPLLLERRRVHLVLIINKRDLERDEALREYATAVQGLARSELSLIVSVGLGTTEERLHLLSHSASLAQKSLQAKFYRGGATVYSTRPDGGDDDVVFPYPVHEIQKINHHLAAGDEDDLRESISTMFSELTAGSALPPSLIKSVVIQLVSGASNVLAEQAISMREFVQEGTPILEQIDRTQSIAELESWVTDLYLRINRAIRRRADEYSAVVRGALAFVHEHYAEPISLSHIAEHLGMTQQYVSKRFKEELGVNYVDYLNRYRLEAAREELLAGNTTVRAVGESVGFSNPQYFIKRFRERYGLTPAQYRDTTKVSL